MELPANVYVHETDYAGFVRSGYTHGGGKGDCDWKIHRTRGFFFTLSTSAFDRSVGRSSERDKERANLESVIGPGSDLEEAALGVVREILDVHETRRLVNGGRLPVDRAVEVDGRLRHHGHLVVAVRAAADRGGGMYVRQAGFLGCTE